MNKNIDLEALQEKPLFYIPDKEAPEYNNGKKWSFSNIYHLNVLRDIYKISIQCNRKNLKNIHNIFLNHFEGFSNKWTERKTLEYLNALVNFRLLNADYSTHKLCFVDSEIGSELSKSDLAVFKEIFFSYFRFKEMSSWFLDQSTQIESLSEVDLFEKSKPLYYLSDNNRFTDTILYDVYFPKEKYVFDKSMTHQMRFWDVFLKWGIMLNIIDRYNLGPLGIRTIDKKDISVVYFVKPIKEFDLVSFIENSTYIRGREIFIPDLLFELSLYFRYSIESLKDFIIKELMQNNNLTYERTSKIFLIKRKESERAIKEATYLYPIIDGSFVSHIIIRK